MHYFRIVILLFSLSFLCANPGQSENRPELPVTVSAKERCAVCGMFVAKYPTWVVQLSTNDGKVVMFDGPKDMFVYYFNPSRYQGAHSVEITDVKVKDYYSQKWLDARKTFYVIGSDVHGPMGNEFVPFETVEAAENFMGDHKGEKILSFEEVTPEQVQSMRMGHKMHRMK